MEALNWSPESSLSADELLDLLGDDGESFLELDLESVDVCVAVPLVPDAMSHSPSAQVETVVTSIAAQLQPLKPHCSNSTSTSQLDDAAKKKTSLQRQKDEAAQLKSVVAELEAQLRNLRGASRLSGASHHSASVISYSQSVQKAALALSFWRVVAQRQLHERHEAEQENAELRRMLREQALLAKSLERMVRKRPLLMKAHQETNGERRAAAISQKDSDVFRVLINNTNERMHTMDAFLKKKNLTPAMTEVNSTTIVSSNDSQQGVHIECTKARVMPFNLHAVSAAIWMQLRRNITVLGGTKLQINVLKHTNELLVTKHETPANAKTENTFGRLTIFSVCKRVTEGKKVQLVWEYLVERTGSVARGDPLIYLNIHGCGQITRVTSNDGDQQPATLFQSHVRLVPVYIEPPHRCESTQSRKFDNKVFIDNVIKAHQLNAQQFTVFVQNALVGGCR